MTSVTSTPTTAPTSNTSQAGAASTALDANFDMFLKLLTAQMQNQDPLDPMDTAQYTQQLVQYSQVEQSIASNKNLESILGAMGAQDLAQATSLIGHKVTVDSAMSGLGDEPAQWNWAAQRGTTQLVATISDINGNVVDKRTIDSSGAKGTFEWDGKLSDGTTADPGAYTLALTATDASGADVPIDYAAVGTATAVERINGVVNVIINGVGTPLSMVHSVKD
ncbi:flagellar hook assembly protein FlgD [Sphingomonas sp.]|uniref:flagellar hook assembly protein FlgD n=1 Tax=Sphingomonas sp. TaxID=28214 RepID=UPI001B279347|nr:flagellar hook assembly protein FlgD [Sphingomonas sp.]MBO9713501.1 flagellar hook assembly protein FlgD [Sphingomonas sp.]